MRRLHSALLVPLAVALALAACGDSETGSGAVSDTGETDDVAASDTGADTRTDAAPDVEDSGVDAEPDTEPDTEPDAEDAGTDAVIDIGPTPCADDQCDIDDTCWDNGDANPDNPCEACLVVVARDAWSPDDAASCDDGDACTRDDACMDGACVGTVDPCDDGDPCTTGSCDPDTGACTQATNDAPCSDGDPCTVGDVCVDGACTAGGEDLACPTDDNPCTVSFCDPSAGCGVEALSDVPCDDGDPCTVGDVCLEGACIAGAEPLSCDDGSVCTIDRCIPGVGCDSVSIADRCSDDNPCTDETCDAELGCIYPFNSEPCDDGSLCTSDDTCAEGLCVGAPVPFDDGNLCTDDACDPAIGPVSVPNADDCDDGDACTVGDVCAEGGCEPGVDPLICDDENLCTDDTCDAAEGCVFTPNTAPCDDGDVCTVDDTCGDGSCVAGAPLDCDDGNVCTTDTCDADDGCQHTLIVSNACRPTITVTSPARAATLLRDGSSTVTVTGTVASDAGDITTFTLNGEDVAVADDGAFSVDLDANVGSNTLAFFAEDALGSTRERVQGFHLSDTFYDPAPTGDGGVTPGLGLWLAQVTLDDGAPPPPTDFAAIFEQVLSTFDLISLLPNPVAENQGAAGANYDIFIEERIRGGVNLSQPVGNVRLDAVDGGLGLNVVLTGPGGGPIVFGIRARKRSCAWWNLVCLAAPGTVTGDFNITSVTIDAIIGLDVVDGELDVSLSDVSVDIVVPDPAVTNLSFDLFGLISGLVEGLVDDLITDVETEFVGEIDAVIAPLLADALGALALNLAFDLPSLAPDGDPIAVSLATDFAATDFQDADPGPQGGLLSLRAWATAAERAVPAGSPFDDNLGSPARGGCAAGPQTMVVPREAPLEVVFPDDTLNQILHAAWWGGFLEFPLDPSLLGDLDLSEFGISDLTLDVSAWLPPAAFDCADGTLRLYVADLRIDASLALFGRPLDLVVWVAFEAPITLSAADGELNITVDEIENVQLEVNVVDEGFISAEGTVRDLLLAQVVPALGDLLGGGEPLAGFPLPEFDLSDALGLPPGSLLISIDVIDDPDLTPRIEGNTIVYGRLR